MRTTHLIFEFFSNKISLWARQVVSLLLEIGQRLYNTDNLFYNSIDLFNIFKFTLMFEQARDNSRQFL